MRHRHLMWVSLLRRHCLIINYLPHRDNDQASCSGEGEERKAIFIDEHLRSDFLCLRPEKKSTQQTLARSL